MLCPLGASLHHTHAPVPHSLPSKFKQETSSHAQSLPPSSVLHSSAASRAECTKIARFSAAAAASFTTPQKIARVFEAPRCAISSAKKMASEPRFLLPRKWVKMVLAAEFLVIPSSAVKIASERRCAILVHSDPGRLRGCWTCTTTCGHDMRKIKK